MAYVAVYHSSFAGNCCRKTLDRMSFGFCVGLCETHFLVQWTFLLWRVSRFYSTGSWQRQQQSVSLIILSSSLTPLRLNDFQKGQSTKFLNNDESSWLKSDQLKPSKCFFYLQLSFVRLTLLRTHTDDASEEPQHKVCWMLRTPKMHQRKCDKKGRKAIKIPHQLKLETAKIKVVSSTMRLPPIN